uniref:Uncharacterized protein n=1 Tax=Salix viminalis TaxID=40686 RepID=A0A6N2MK55_SALVM
MKAAALELPRSGSSTRSSCCTISAVNAHRSPFLSLLLLKSISTSLTRGISLAWPCMERMNGTFLRRGTGSTRTIETNRAAGGLLKATEPTSRLGSRRPLESRRLWCFTPEKLPRERKPTGLCTSIAGE